MNNSNLSLKTVSSKKEYIAASRSDVGFVYYNKGRNSELYWNANGSKAGLGPGGGQVLAFTGGPELQINDILIL